MKKLIAFITTLLFFVAGGFSQKVGIGTVTPENTLHIFKGSAGAVTGHVEAPLIVENSTNCYINVLAPDANESGIAFGNPSSYVSSGIIFNRIGTPNGLQFTTNGNISRMVLTDMGNLGIGTTTPAYKMDIADRIRIRSGVNSTAGLWLNNPGNSATIAFMGVKDVDVAGFYGNFSGWGLVMNTNTGAVAVGNQNPVAGYKLSVQGNQYLNGALVTTGTAEIGGAADVTGNLYVGGKIGIGGSAYAPLEVFTGVPGTYAENWTYLKNSTFPPNALSIRAHGSVVAEFFAATSDARMKDITGISNPSKDLETINALQITDYTMKDKIMYGNKPFKKVIAQEVEKVYPQVVSTNVGYIPNVYAVPGKIEKTTKGYLLHFTNKHNLSKAAKKIQLMIERDTRQFEIVSIPSEYQVVINATDLKTDKVFVYGEEVNDFRSVDYEGLTTLNITATQELSKIVKKQQAEIEAQNIKITELTEAFKAFKNKNTLVLN